jgi:chaperonin GroES
MIRPLHDRILVKRLRDQDTTKGGIFIPDSAREKSMEAQVVAVGAGRTLKDGSVRPLQTKVGDRVLFGKYAGTEVKVEGEDHLLLREDDLLAVVEL